MITEASIHQLDSLINQLETTPVQFEEETSKKYRAFIRTIIGPMLFAGKRYGEVSGSLEHLMRSDVKEYIRSIDNDLEQQVRITSECVDSWLQKGEKIAPYYFWRITVILRKEKLLDLEKRFLAAYCRHFYGIVGGRYETISARGDKIGVAPTGESGIS